MIDYQVDEDAGVIDIAVDGAITRADYEALIPVLDGLLARHETLRAVETVRKIGPIDWSLWWQDLKWVIAHRDRLARCAVITDHGWIGPVTRAAAALLSGEVRVFPEAKADEARAWVREG